MVESGLEAGHCPWAGRRIVHLIHGGRDQLRANIENAAGPEQSELLMKATEAQRVSALRFELQVKPRLVEVQCDKTAFVEELPHIIAGLLGMYFGFSIAACGEIARRIISKWENRSSSKSIHRVAVKLFSTETLHASRV